MKDNTVNIIGGILRKPYTPPCIETLRMDLSGGICESGGTDSWGSADGPGYIESGDGDGTTKPDNPWEHLGPDSPDQGYGD